MQSNRTLGIVVLLFVILGGALLWRMTWNDARPTAPPALGETGQRDASAAAAAGDRPEDATPAVTTGNEATLREAVTLSGPASSDLPSIVGQVVGTNDQPIVDAEVVCVPGIAFASGWGSFEPGDVDLLDPTTMAERMRSQAEQRVVVRTDDDGRFRVRAEGTTRRVSLRVLARGYRVFDRRVERPVESDTDIGLLALATGAIISGRVLGPGGNPVEGANVSCMLEIEQNLPMSFELTLPGTEQMEAMRIGQTCATDAAGRFELPHAEAGDISLRARHPAHPTARLTGLSVAAGRSLTDVVVSLAGGAEIRGTVVGVPEAAKGLLVMAAKKRSADGEAPAGLMGLLGDPSDLLGEMGMALGEREADMQSDGSFVLRGLATDSNYRIWVAQEGRGFTGSRMCSDRVDAASGTALVRLQYEPGVAVRFVVVGADSGAPIERLWVRDQLLGGGGLADMMARGPSNARSKSYPEGEVTVAGLRPKKNQKLRLTIDATGYRQLQRGAIELPGEGDRAPLDLGTLRLEPRPVLQVTVLTADSGRPISGADVRLAPKQDGNRNPFARMMRGQRGSSPRSGQTDADGRCTLNALDGDVGELTVESRRHAPFVAEVPVADGASEQTVRLVVGGIAKITVLGDDGEPVADTLVEHKTPTGDVDRRSTDAAGLVRFDHLAPGSHAFRLAGPDGGFPFAFGGRRGNAGQPKAQWQTVDVADRVTVELTLDKRPLCRVRGIVRENGMPLVGARLSLREGADNAGGGDPVEGMMGELLGQMGSGSKRQTKTAEDGGYELVDLPPGEHRLRITHKDRAMPSEVPLSLRIGQNVSDVELDMTTLRGIVRDAEGNAVGGARVTARHAPEANDEQGAAKEMMAGMLPGMGIKGSGATSDATGAFELRGIDPDVPLQVKATAKGFAPAAAAVTVARGQARTGLELRLGAAGRIRVSVADKPPFAAVQAKFVGDDAAGVAPVMQVLNKGKGTLTGLRPGTWELECQTIGRGGEPPAKRIVEVVAGQTIEVAF